MEEHQVTIGDESLALPAPFFVIATQNPLEHEGTYPLPEAQLDRFTMKIVLDYPKLSDEKQIFLSEAQNRSEKPEKKSEAPLTASDFLEMTEYIRTQIRVDEKIYDYIAHILDTSRQLAKNGIDGPLSYGASTRAGLAMIRCARVRAIMMERDYVLPEDIKSLTHDILRHRIGLSYESMGAGITTDQVISDILESVKVI